ncbi:hypothetical protein BJV82DRAFT_607279 [Fennellomyces sp. T-0311]|nr:hypothetical protein BJV82DRAFT_607279 [Fennellomyces sp. T-0311]
MPSSRSYIPNTTVNNPSPYWYSDHRAYTEPNQVPYPTGQSHWSSKRKRNKASILSHEPYIIPDHHITYGKGKNVEGSAGSYPFPAMPISCQPEGDSSTGGCELDPQTPYRMVESPYPQIRHQHDGAAHRTGRNEFLQPTSPALPRVPTSETRIMTLKNANKNSKHGSSTQLTTPHNSNADALHDQQSRNLQVKSATNNNDQQHEMRPIECYYPACRLTFDCLDQVDEHVKTHDNVNKKTQQFKFACDVCKKKKVYARQDSIKRHQISCQVARHA